MYIIACISSHLRPRSFYSIIWKRLHPGLLQSLITHHRAVNWSILYVDCMSSASCCCPLYLSTSLSCRKVGRQSSFKMLCCSHCPLFFFFFTAVCAIIFSIRFQSSSEIVLYPRIAPSVRDYCTKTSIRCVETVSQLCDKASLYVC